MTSYHAWKRRLWGPDYPIENGPPYVDPETGAPMLPGGIQSGPYQGVDDDGPMAGNPAFIQFTGPASGDLTVGVMIDDQTAAAGTGGRWVGCTVQIASGDTATQIGDKVAAAFDARGWSGWLATDSSNGLVTFNPQSAGSATAYVVYGPAQSGVSGNVPGPMPISQITVDTSSLPSTGGPAGSTAEVDFKANGSQKSTTHVPADRPKVETIAALEAELVAMQSVQIVIASEDSMTLVAANGYTLSDGAFYVIPPSDDTET